MPGPLKRPQAIADLLDNFDKAQKPLGEIG